MARLADKLTLILEAGNGLADRMHLIVQASRDQRARLPSLNDKSVTKALEGILKKWPDIGPDADRAPGVDQVITKARGEFERLEGFYNTILDLCEWKETALHALNETANTIHTFRSDETPVFFANFLDLLVLLGQLVLLIPEISDRRIFLVMYRLLYYNLKGGIEVNFAKLSHFVADYEDRWRKLPDELKTVSPKAGAAVCALAMDWYKMRDVNVLRKEGTLSLTLTPTSLTLPVVDNFVYQIINSERVYKWLVYGFLLCPEEMALSDALGLMKSVLAVSYAAPVVRDVSYQMHEHYDDVIDKHKNKTFKAVLKKEKKLVDEALAAAAQTKHKDRRTFIRQEVTNLCNIMRDQPGLIAPKLPIILSTLAVAKEEVLWYFRHVEAPMPKGTKRTEPLDDRRIGELIYHMQLLVSLVRAQHALIGKYYATYLAGPHAQKARELLGDVSSKLPTAAPLLKHIADELQSVTETSDLSGMRATWARAECLHASAISGAAGAGAAMAKYALMIRHTKYVDSLDALLDEVADLKITYFWRDSVVAAFDRTLESHQHSLYVLAFFRLYASWPGNATKWTPEERDVVGSDSVTTAKTCMERMMGRILGLVNVQVKAWLDWESQLTTENAAYAWLVRLKDSRPDKYFPTPPVEPGSESGFKLRPGLEALRQAELCLGNLCCALNEVTTFMVFDHRFAPREYLREALAASFKDFVQRVALPIQAPGAEDIEIPRPSLVERQVAVYVNILKTIENYLELNTGDLVREVYIGQVHHRILSGLLTDWCADGPVDLGNQLVKPFVVWYTEFVTKRIVPSDKNTVVFAPNRTGFASKPGQAFKADRLGDLVELRAYASLVGPYGVRLLDRELLRALQTAVQGVREVLVANKVVLDELGKTYTREATFADSVRKFKQQDLDTMVARLINVGNALHMRAVLHEGLRQVTTERIHYIFNAISAAANQYPRNTFSVTDYLAVDELVKQLGMPVQSADHGLKAFLQRGMGGSDVAIWNLAPVAFATALFYSRTWQDADFRPALEAHSNNVSATAIAILELLTAFKSTPSTGTIPEPKDVCNILMQFVEMGATLALRAVKTPPQGKSKMHCASVITFLDRFVEASPFLTRDMVEPVLPYAFIRTMYRDLYDANNDLIEM